MASVLRPLRIKIVHKRKNEKVPSSMTDSEIGAQKKTIPKESIFILNSVISDVLGSVLKKTSN